MFSTIGQIFTKPPREAEHADTRQEIRRHDPDTEKNRRGKKEQEDPLFDMDDSASVSVSALLTFLENFVKTRESEAHEEAGGPKVITPAQVPPGMQAPEHPTPKNGEAARAASAYQHTARSQRGALTEQRSSEASESLLANSEIRQIYSIIGDLQDLKDRGIRDLFITKGDSFIASIEEAIEMHGP